MPLEVEFHPLALIDLVSAIEYYEEQHKGLGYRFLEYVEEITDIISSFPTIYTLASKQKKYRKAVIPDFPSYSSIKLKGEIFIGCMFQTNNNPEKIVKRFQKVF